MTQPAISGSSSATVTASWMKWTGRVISGLLVAAFSASAVPKFLQSTAAEMEKGGWPPSVTPMLGVTELICALLYAIPQTSVLGAILLTGYMGGAIATHVRLGEPFFIQAIIGVLVWLGLFLRDARLRALIPLRRV